MLLLSRRKRKRPPLLLEIILRGMKQATARSGRPHSFSSSPAWPTFILNKGLPYQETIIGVPRIILGADSYDAVDLCSRRRFALSSFTHITGRLGRTGLVASILIPSCCSRDCPPRRNRDGLYQ